MFNVSFLDLLSGALGAVLILFIIVPKMDQNVEAQLQELESFKSLKMDVKGIQSLMSNLESSIPQADFDKMSSEYKQQYQKFKEQYANVTSELKKVESVISSLEAEIKEVQEKLAKCDGRRKELTQEVKTLKSKVKELEEITKDSQKMKKEIEDLKAKIVKCEDEKKKVQTQASALKSQLQGAQSQIPDVNVEDIQAQVQQLEAENLELKAELEKQEKQTNEKGSADVGVRMGKNVVFVVDISGSMDDNPEPQKLDEVKAGLKMLIATLPENSYNVDIVVFPYSATENFKAFYTKLTKVTQSSKYEIYRYINKLKARGCTPTRDAMEFVLNHPSYKSAETIMYLSDGLPTLVQGSNCKDESVEDVLAFIKGLNKDKTINTIGVGSEFRDRASISPKVKFMKKLARENNGFYIGF